MDPSNFIGADEQMLKEIRRQAELQLAAQLQAGLGADARALSFVSLMAAATVVVAGGAVALLTSTPPNAHLGWTCASMVGGFIAAMGFAIGSARPVDFDYAGSWPRNWINDIGNGVNLNAATAEQMIDFDERLGRNAARLRCNAKLMFVALLLAIGTLIVGCGIGLLVVTAH